MTSTSSSASFSDFGQNSGYIQELYELFLKDPSLVGETWATFFSNYTPPSSVPSAPSSNGHSKAIGASVVDSPRAARASTESEEEIDPYVQEKVFRLVQAYRSFGHLRAKINPLNKGVQALPDCEDLDPESYGFTRAELDQEYFCSGFAGRERMKLADLIESLQQVYCGSIGAEFSHLIASEERSGLERIMETRILSDYGFNQDEKLMMLKSLVDSEGLEAELHKKYVGAKRFGVQGGETLMPVLEILAEECGRHQVREAIIGMAHRGRLNVLINLLKKPLEDLFAEFEDRSSAAFLGAGDVKYHLGWKTERMTSSGNFVNLSMAPNPSHLEAVDPIVQGMVRARQDLEFAGDRKKVLPILIHGDAAFAGQGIVYETIEYSRVRGYATGGTVHIVVNNQVGFTTDAAEARSSTYCSDVAKSAQAPIFHVNGEDVEACAWATKVAFEFRLKYQRDVVLDIYCFRKYGHNEADDPSFTQPQMYSEIKNKKAIADVYSDFLISKGGFSSEEYTKLIADYRERFSKAQEYKKTLVHGEVSPVRGRIHDKPFETGVSREVLDRVASTLTNYPEGFSPHPKLATIIEKRVQTLKDGEGIEWGFAEALAYGSLMLEGRNIRLSGQDCGRGTFSHRHLELSNYSAPDSAPRFLPLNRLKTSESEGRYEVFNSTLSENGVMGFEFGYGSVAPRSLVLWEGQFGDFANGAQIVIDQFMAASEAKWAQLSSLVLLLPHGYEGQGAEHSSARLERFLQLCAESNISVCYPSNAASYFHMLRRHALSSVRRPLIVMTPKSLLRLPEACVPVSALTSERFREVLSRGAKNGKPEHVLFMTGKIYYEVEAALKKQGIENVQVVRLEQLYPFAAQEIKDALGKSKLKTYTWVQEEPKNMGAWAFADGRFRSELGLTLEYIGRPESATTACGSSKWHAIEQQKIIQEVLKRVE